MPNHCQQQIRFRIAPMEKGAALFGEEIQARPWIFGIHHHLGGGIFIHFHCDRDQSRVAVSRRSCFAIRRAREFQF